MGINGLLKIGDISFRSEIFEMYANTGGVYKMIAAKNGERIPINRFLGTDLEGVLYIGKATSFIDRVVALKKAIAPDYKGKSHICGRRYKLLPSIAIKFPYDLLFIELIPTDTPEAKERELLLEYVNKFGEVPPLNAI